MFKAELVRNKGTWDRMDDLEIAPAEHIDGINDRRPHGEIGVLPPASY